MDTNYNRIKVADLETNQPDKILKTNENGELEFSDNVTGGSQDLQSVLENGAFAVFDGRKVISLFSDLAPEDILLRASNEDNSNMCALDINKDLVNLFFYKNGVQGGLSIQDGLLKLNQSTAGSANTPNTNTSLSFEAPVGDLNDGGTVIKIPAKPSRKDENNNPIPYKLATLDDVSIPVSATIPGIINNTSLQELGGVDKTIYGVRIGRGNYSGTNSNTALGGNTLSSNISGIRNTAVGRSVLPALTTASDNTGLGSLTLNSVTTGTGNTGLGSSNLYYTKTGGYNTSVGFATMQNNITGSYNTALGGNAGFRINSDFNIAIGYRAFGSDVSLPAPSTGQYNTVIGFQAGRDLTTGSNNILIENITNASITSGSNNIVLNPRQKSGINTGSGNTIIGGFDGAFAPNDSELVVLATGTGKIAIRKNTNDELIAPTLTKALIDSGGARSLITKEYLDATLDIIGLINNSTNTSLNAATLNSTYPNARQGLRVYCPSISGGALMYEKTGDNWIQFAVTTVL
ncbi:hypothetical protein ASE40_21205 [Flavobacterium sp. Root935]|jgi:hypothetical protein|uniref:hypothetical protein n=1 Tax=Flavobacterium sp. Root935 TaxID=1736610 RepID=UPI00070DFF11|nr:hypothetical protein [Flavobacterium sp. Root935]KRD58823.1 hypothetical protein ASE40_21205 [Flavobacterium sp. Root935]